MVPRVHYHTDCPWFAGCENMLANLLNDAENRAQFEVTLSYRASDAYTQGLRRRTRLDFPVFPLRYPEPSTAIPAPATLPNGVRRLLRFTSRLLTTYPLLAYEVWVLRRLFLRLAPDVVHINNGGYPAALSARAAAIAARLARVRNVVMVVNNLAEPYRGPRFAARPLVDRFVAGSVSRFVTGSGAAATQLRHVLGLPETRAVAYPNGIALRAPTETPEQTRQRLGVSPGDGVIFGMVALMEPRKGHRVLIDAAAATAAARPAVPFTILLEGTGPLHDALQALVRERGLEARCRFVGTESNVMNLMGAIDVLVLPSIAQEDFPNVVLEAMGMGKPVIASRLAGTPEQVQDGVTGLLVPPGDSSALAAALARLADDGAARRAMGRAARARFEERFTAPVSVRRYSELYHSLISAHEP